MKNYFCYKNRLHRHLPQTLAAGVGGVFCCGLGFFVYIC